MARPELFLPNTESELSDWLRTRATGPLVTGTSNVEPVPGLSVVSTANMSDVVSFRPRDLTIEVGAGLRMQRLREIVASEGLWIPVAGIGAARSVGGWIAAASPSIWDPSRGPVRRQLLGCRVIAPDGSDLTWGRAVMKNVAGYDLPRLMTGSRGRLGVLTRVTLRLWPRPGATTAWEIHGGVDPLALESLGVDAVASSWNRVAGERVTAVFAGSAESVNRRERKLAQWSRGSGFEIEAKDPARALEPGGGRGERRTGSVVYRLTPGRRYLPNVFRALVAPGEHGPARIEAIPQSGTMFVHLDDIDPDRAETDAALALLARLSPPDSGTGEGAERHGRMEIGVELGRKADHAAVEALRSPGARSIEHRLEQAFGAWPPAWQADYL